MQVQHKAWEHLTKTEQMALSLVVVSERTKKEASIIMNISPYKFTEVYLRARKYFVMFSDYYQTHDSITIDSPAIPTEFALYVSLLLNKRKRSATILNSPGFIEIKSNKVRKELWTELITQLQLQNNLELVHLIQEFDRWNNFRILPKSMQLPAAFPRRKNRNLKKILQNLYAISDQGWNILEQKYSTTTSPNTHLPLITSDYPAEVLIKDTQGVQEYMTRNKIPVFAQSKQAQDFAELVFDYRLLKTRSTYSARKFWANFRLIFREALNYKELLNVQIAAEEIISQNDRKFLKSLQKPKREIKGRQSTDTFYPS